MSKKGYKMTDKLKDVKLHMYLANKKSKPIRIKEKIIEDLRKTYGEELDDTLMINIALAQMIIDES